MIRIRIIPFALFCAVLSIPFACAQDLFRYRDFKLGMNLIEAAEQAGMKPALAKVTSKRAAMIQELEWRQGFSFPPSTDPVNEILLGFYNNQLYRVVVKYDQDATEGLTDQDLVERISATYGKSTTPVATIISSSSSQAFGDSEKVIARWEDSEYSVSLFRFAYRSCYGLAVLSKRLDILATAAIADSIRLNDQEAPQREIDRQKKEDIEKLAAGQKARIANKANFRP